MRKLLVLLRSDLSPVSLCVGLAAWQQQRTLEQPLQSTEERLLDVSSGSMSGGMLARLEREEALYGMLWLHLYWRFNLPGRALYNGECRPLPEMTSTNLLELWCEGEVVQYNLTLVGSWSLRRVREMLAKQGKLGQTLVSLSDDEIMQCLGKPDEMAEGRFFLDTYRYAYGTCGTNILRRAYQRMQTILAKEWDSRSQDLPYRDVYQALVVASLAGKETGVPGERSQAADVFVRHLQRGMLLQIDPMVTYGMGERYNGKVTCADLREPALYNTHVVLGVLPTPVTLAGREAIHTALYLAESEALYFVARGGDNHVFSSSLDEYDKAVCEYQLERRSGYRSSPASVTPSPQ